MTESRKRPQGFIVVLPGEIIEIPQDDDKSWLTLFYALPKELVGKVSCRSENPPLSLRSFANGQVYHIMKRRYDEASDWGQLFLGSMGNAYSARLR